MNTNALNLTELSDETLLRADAVRRLLGGISEDTLARRLKDGSVPAPIGKLGPRVRVWTVGQVRAALASLHSRAA